MMRSSSLTRHKLLRGVAPLVMALMLLMHAQSASAGIGWCRADPLVTVNGRTGHIYVESTEAMFTSRTGPIAIEIRVPVGTTYSAVPLDAGFGLGYAITFVEDSRLSDRGSYVEVRVRTFAPALDSSLPVKVIFHSDNKLNNDTIKTTTANTWVETGTVRL